MSRSTALGVTPNERPTSLAEFHNGWGWSPSIWDRLMTHNDAGLNHLWRTIEVLPEWQQVPLVLTFDTGVIPAAAYKEAADLLEEFDRRLPEVVERVNHVPAVAELLRSEPPFPFFGIWGTSVSTNPFDPWDSEADEPGSGLPLSEFYVLGRHKPLLPKVASR